MSNTNTSISKNYAGFWIRALAAMADSFILLLIGLGISLTFGSNFFQLEPVTVLEYADFITTLIIQALYFIIFWAYYDGVTPGKKLLGLKTIRSDGKPMTLSSSTMRWIGYFASTGLLGLGYFWVGFDKKKQGWHDKIADTCVVKTRVAPQKKLAILFAALSVISSIIIIVISFNMNYGY